MQGARIIVVLWFTSFVNLASAQPFNAILVSDVNTAFKPVSTEMVYLGEDLVLSYDSGTGYEPHILKKGSNTPAILKDINPGDSPSSPRYSHHP
jgi:hypothetical protein